MCQFCVEHTKEGKEWYLKSRAYSTELARELDSPWFMDEFFKNFDSTEILRKLLLGVKHSDILSSVGKSLATNYMRANHFGQIVPLEHATEVLRLSGMITLLPCPCVKLLTGESQKKCIGLGPHMFDTLTRFPDYQSFDVLTLKEAESMVTEWDEKGFTHSVWTFRTPYIAAMCNCTEQCMAYKFAVEDRTIDMLRKSDFVSWIDQEKCIECGMCADYCKFGAIDVELRWIDPNLCYGCGVCRQVCPVDAIAMRKKSWRSPQPLFEEH